MNNDLTAENIQNLMGWLQEILKESQVSRGLNQEMRDKVNLIPEIRDRLIHPDYTTNSAERKIDDTRSNLEARLNQIEVNVADLKNILNDLRSRIDKLK